MKLGFYDMQVPPTADWLLMQYAAGALPPYESMLMAAYIAVSAVARGKMQAYEAEGGRMIETVEPAPVTHSCLNTLLARIETRCAEQKAQAQKPQPPEHAGIPPVVFQLLSSHCPQQKVAWEDLAPGVAKMDIRLCRSEPQWRRLRLMKLAPHQPTPQHAHDGIEMTLVLDGSFDDETGSYTRGELVIVTDQGLQHTPKAGHGGCLCMTLTEAPLRFSNPLVRFLNFFRGI